MAVAPPPFSDDVLAEIRKKNEPLVPEPTKAVEFAIDTVLPLERFAGLSAMMAMLFEPRAGSSLMELLFLKFILPTTHTIPANVTVGLFDISRSHGIFIGPIVTDSVILYGHTPLYTPPVSASCSHSAIFASDKGNGAVGLSGLSG